MLRSNWSEGSAKSFGKAYVIRQRLGRAKPAKSNAPHKCMGFVDRQILCAKLERQAVR
jgi:hypothetical protein